MVKERRKKKLRVEEEKAIDKIRYPKEILDLIVRKRTLQLEQNIKKTKSLLDARTENNANEKVKNYMDFLAKSLSRMESELENKENLECIDLLIWDETREGNRFWSKIAKGLINIIWDIYIYNEETGQLERPKYPELDLNYIPVGEGLPLHPGPAVREREGRI